MRAFVELNILWKKFRTPELKRLVVNYALKAVHLGDGVLYEKNVRSEGIEYLLGSPVFNREAVIYMLLYGTFKMRFFALTYIILPRCLRKILLQYA